MNKSLLLAPIVVFLLLISACSGPPAVGRELRDNEQKWAAQRISDYSYTLRIGCFCPPEITSPVVVEVRDGTTRSVTYEGTGQSATNSSFNAANTVEDLFAIIREAINNKVDKLTVEYDPDLGYPKQISIDPIEQAVD